MTKKIILISLVLFLTVFIINSQENIENKIIHKIILKGLKKVKSKEVKDTILSSEGAKLDLSQVDKDYKNLFSLGSFEEIYISTETALDKESNMPIQGMIDLVFEFIEKSTIRKTIFKGNKNLPFASMLDAAKIKRGDFYDVASIHADMTAITEKYHEKGFANVKINFEIYQDEELKAKNQVDIIYTVDEGIESYISEIIIEGNSNVNDFTIKSKMKTKERKFFGLLKGTFIDSKFFQDLEDIKNYYRDLGYYLIEINDPEVNKYNIEEEGIKKEVYKIKIVIKEGEKYTYGGLKLKGNKIFNEEELTYNLRIKEGQIFNYSRYQEGIFTLRKKYNDSGYVQTIINDELKIDKEKKIIFSNIEIIESKQSYIEAIYFRGNEKTKNYILERTVYTEVGEIFNSAKLMDSLINLYNLGFFSNVNYEIQQGSAPGLLKIIYLVEEQLTAEVKFGLQIPASDEVLFGMSLFGELGEKNFLGRALTAKGKIETSISTQGMEVSFEDPWFLNYPWSLGGTVKFYHYWIKNVLKKITDDDRKDFDTGTSDEDIRKEWANESGGNDAKNQNYLNAKGDPFDMGYHQLTFTIQPTTGFRFKKYFGISGGISYEPNYYWMPTADEKDNNPENIFDNYLSSVLQSPQLDDNWRHRFRLFSTFVISTTKKAINPYEGIKFSVSAAFSFIHYDSIILTTKFTWYWKILDVYFNDWPFKNVLVFNSNFSFIFPGFQYNENDPINFGDEPVLHSTDWIVIDGLFSGRGWANSLAGQNYFNLKYGFAKLDFSLEYRIPIYESIVWIAGFIDFFNLIEGPRVYYTKTKNNSEKSTYVTSEDAWQWWNKDIANNNDHSYVKDVNQPFYNPMGIDNWYGSVGFGIELTFPQLPLSFFIVKRFKINYYSGIEWQLNKNTADLDFVLSMVGVAF